MARCCVTRDHSFPCHSHTNIQTIPAFTPQPQGITALRLVLIEAAHEGMARLSGPGCLLTYEITVPHQELNTVMVNHPRTNWARHRVTSLMCTTLPDRQNNKNIFNPATQEDNRIIRNNIII